MSDVRTWVGIERQALVDDPATSGMGGARQRVTGLTLRATDLDLVVGDGPEVSGPAVSLLLVASERTAAAGTLSGNGLERLLTADR